MGRNNRTRRKKKQARKAVHKKRVREKSKAQDKEQTLAPTFYKLPDPLEGLNHDQRQQAIKIIAGQSEEEYQKTLSELREILRKHSPLQILSHMSYRGLVVTVDETTGITKLDSENEIFPFHIEFLQALSLQVPPDGMSHNPAPPEVLQQVWDKVKMLWDAQIFRHLDSKDQDLPEDEKAIALVQHLIRGATQAVRNWGYHSQVKRITRELYTPFDPQLRETRGFSATDVVDVFEAIVTETETRQTTHRNMIGNVFRSSGENIPLLVEKYHELIGLESEEAERFLELPVLEEAPLDVVRYMLMAHHDLQLPFVYTFLASDVAEFLSFDKDKVSAILDEYVLEWGELDKHVTEGFHLSNPMWKKPLVKLGDGTYFCPLPASFFSFVIPCMEEILSDYPVAISKRRAEYLEDKVAQIVERRVPGSNIKRNFKWVEDGKNYETDLIAFIDSFALVIECKSGKITPSALRGAPDRLRRHIRELLIEPNQQSLRLKKRLEFLSSNQNVMDPLRDEIGYDLGKVHVVVRVSVCLEDFGTIQSSLNQLEDTGWLPADFTPCPTMNLADFETLFDLLEHPVQILHYLMRREGIEASFGHLADELDLLGLYLITLFDIGDIETNVVFSLPDMSAPLDAYYNSLDAGVTRDKPRPAITPLFASIFSQLELRGIDRWTEIGVALNMFSPDDQKRITTKIASLEKHVNQNWRRKRHKNMIIYTPSKTSSYALGYVMFKNGNANKRRDFMEHASTTALTADHVQTVVVIAKNIDQDETAYDAIALYERSEKSPC